MNKLYFTVAILLIGFMALAGDSNHDRTLTINNLDTVVFDLSQASCSGEHVCIPVSFISDDTVNAVDFSFKYDHTKVDYDSTVNLKAYLTTADNYNTLDSTVYFTSFSLSPIEHNTPLVLVCMDLWVAPITASDFNNVLVYLNGTLCSYEFINSPLQSAVITPSGPTTFASGDSVTLTSTAIPGYAYLWSTGATTQSITVHAPGTYTVTITSSGDCSVTLSVPVTVTGLPIQLIDFYSNENNNVVVLEWSTASETNNDYFTVARSVDTVHWNEIGKIKGNGNSVTFTDYSIIDFSPLIGLNYYRLMQTDFDGVSSYSKIVTEYYSPYSHGVPTVNIYPNPAREILNVEVSENADMQLMDLEGRQIIAQMALKASAKQQVNTEHIISGIYLMKIYNEKFVLINKVLINNQ